MTGIVSLRKSYRLYDIIDVVIVHVTFNLADAMTKERWNKLLDQMNKFGVGNTVVDKLVIGDNSAPIQ